MIAMALANNPDLLIADEPTTALDVTVQAQILNLLRDLQQKHGMAVVLITHDLTVVRRFSDYVYVMQKGLLQEHNTTAALFEAPQHPYTRHLLAQSHAAAPSHCRTTNPFCSKARMSGIVWSAQRRLFSARCSTISLRWMACRLTSGGMKPSGSSANPAPQDDLRAGTDKTDQQ